MMESPFWEFAFNSTGKNFNSNFVFRIFGMKMWWRVIIPIHGDDYSKESADYWHLYLLELLLNTIIMLMHIIVQLNVATMNFGCITVHTSKNTMPQSSVPKTGIEPVRPLLNTGF